jgi:hypothetical protein
MWSTIARLAEKYGRQNEAESVRELRDLLAQGKHTQAKPLWLKIRSFLQDFANVSQIVSAIDLLIH